MANSQHHHEQDEIYFNNHGSNNTIATISQSTTIPNPSHINESTIIQQIPIYAGPPQAAQEANTGNTANEFTIRAAAIRTESATGEPREATQQVSNQRGSISADAINNLAMEHSNQNLFGTNNLPQQPINTMSRHTATATGNKGEINQPASDLHIISHMANSQHNHEQEEIYSNNHGSNNTIATISQSTTIPNQSHINESAIIKQIPIYAGPPQAAQEANTSNTANEFTIRAAANRA